MLRIDQIKNVNAQKVNKVWGYEEIVHNNLNYCFKFLHLQKGFQCSLHYHKVKTETFYLLKGSMIIQLIDQKFQMEVGDFLTISPGTLHRFIGLKKSVILEVSTQDFVEDSYRIENELSGPVDLTFVGRN